jgi:hypothetical protein
VCKSAAASVAEARPAGRGSEFGRRRTAHSARFSSDGVLSSLFEREKGTYAESRVRRLTASLSMTGPEQYIGLDLESPMYEERCHPLPYVFSHGLSSSGRESYEQLAVASTAGLERLPVVSVKKPSGASVSGPVRDRSGL